MPDLAPRLILPALIGDSLALGPHWVYDPAKIAEKLGPCDQLAAPISTYHPGKKAGDQTHYGDQTVLLRDFLNDTKTWDADAFKERWIAYWSTSQSYRDHATRETLEKGQPSDSDELGGAARLAPLLAFLGDRSLAERIAAAREQAGLTHGDPIALDAAEFVTRVADALLTGASIPDALKRAADEGNYDVLAPDAILAQAHNDNPDTIAAINTIGPACPTPQALPSVILLLLRHGETPREALILNARAGGDSAARSLVLGLWLGAHHPTNWLPTDWLENLKSAKR